MSATRQDPIDAANDLEDQTKEQSGVLNDPDLQKHRRYQAEAKSFTTPAIVTLVLYIFLWIPGLIANVIYWREANRIEEIIGRAPEGKGCLVVMLWVMIVIPAIGLAFLILGGGLAAVLGQ